MFVSFELSALNYLFVYFSVETINKRNALVVRLLYLHVYLMKSNTSVILNNQRTQRNVLHNKRRNKLLLYFYAL